MQTSPTQPAELASKATHFNYNKLQAVLCMAASAVVSIALIAWAISTLL